MEECEALEKYFNWNKSLLLYQHTSSQPNPTSVVRIITIFDDFKTEKLTTLF